MESYSSKEYRSRIGAAVRRLRQEENISSSFLAKVLKVSQPTISRIEAGTSSIPADQLCFLAETFHRPLAYFVGGQSKLIVKEIDLIRAGLVHYGARHLQSKPGLDVSGHYPNYAILLKEALSECHDPRVANAVGVTLFHQALSHEFNATKIVATITTKKLILDLCFLSKVTSEACSFVSRYTKPQIRSVENRLNGLIASFETEQGVLVPSSSDALQVSARSIADSLNEGAS